MNIIFYSPNNRITYIIITAMKIDASKYKY